jgi:hypothetical protein
VQLQSKFDSNLLSSSKARETVRAKCSPSSLQIERVMGVHVIKMNQIRLRFSNKHLDDAAQ